MTYQTPFSEQLGLEVPLICGPMYPCSNKELVAAVSAAGGLGVVQPLSMVFVYGDDFREGLRWIRSQTDRPIGMNVLIEKSAKAYEERMQTWVEIALEEGVRFFLTSLGNPRWVVEKVRPLGGIVYHDVTERKWALKALEADVDGLICVNERAGGHAGQRSAERLLADLKDLGKPLICAGGIGDPQAFREALEMGYAGVQMGTRFIATQECKAHEDYKQAILKAHAEDIVLTDRLSGTPCAIIKTPAVERMGINASWLEKKLLKNRRTKYLMRTLYALQSVWKLKQAALKGNGYKDFWQAGKSVETIHEVLPAAEIVKSFAAALESEVSVSET
ncbi:2-nitropropane dioxygenase [bacterium (Candidatus Blackallbacteria) CG17_big_fil_post_rev_8_21_14_2_50_48_46]|uniref:2-nitropropane dioxygenase n=1 Tax=bacterium (Candidatus Blackallbacteria) CG17_big_fil_post_rev_8_21_14_2_50_48_46 TaxID=2014261 RepID=A0A2M7FY65_9BACT|nr:MAG: 2-nitropropane dioxygenase [bacterium (Candidatus Blackallbacteria) CG18_big_fil_WC_8_21_14_2_50_49_26]PIW13970.1 MAG: 2-nitropropane dioxygenase [bacterium (Candidatus Blackallbacteria) CG17_big_fil_post_rev_8_21_14_2_50_48_46]PIW46821.1 MAG: 2-nitropropane dioxygenase [bacterium (Candidatus Blackallbacteria) CG13_big_fil_rev_8_21_14_2_50_49_14]